MREREVYLIKDTPAYDAVLLQRTAAQEGAFFLPHLRPGMRLLDCGCGPGSITLGLATVDAPGQVVGIDLEPRQLRTACTLARQQGGATLHVAQATAYQLPFPDATFDAAFAHNVLLHLGDPLAALRELRRVLRRGGVLGIRNADPAAEVLEPTTPGLRRWQALWVRLHGPDGANLRYMRQQRRLLLAAGFARSEAHASVESGGTLELTWAYAQRMLLRLAGPAGWATAVARGWVTRAEVEELQAAILAWGERPDAFVALPYYSAVGWVGD